MRLLLVTALALCACGPGLADKRSLTAGVSDSFLAAVQRKDTASIAGHLADVVAYGGLYFTDVACMQKFPAPAKIDATKRDAFVACLATLPLTQSARGDALYAVLVYDYAPGIEIEVKFEDRGKGAQLAWIGYSGRRGLFDALPTVSPAALERVRTAGSARPQLSAAAAAALEAESNDLEITFAWAWFKVCVDAEGNVTSTHVREASSALVEQTFLPLLADWKFKPLTLGGSRGVPACALLRFTHPANTEREVLPLAFETPAGVARIANVRGRRISGEIGVVPEDEGKMGMMRAGIDMLVGAFAYCFDEAGRVNAVRVLDPTGLASYDAKIESVMRKWRFRPYVVDGKPVTACSTATFIYSQH